MLIHHPMKVYPLAATNSLLSEHQLTQLAQCRMALEADWLAMLCQAVAAEGAALYWLTEQQLETDSYGLHPEPELTTLYAALTTYYPVAKRIDADKYWLMRFEPLMGLPLLLAVNKVVKLDALDLWGRLFAARLHKLGEKIVAKQQAERLNNLLEGSHVGCWEWDVPSGQTVFDDRWAEMLGYTLAELAPISLQTREKLAHPDDLPLAKARLEAYFRGESERYEVETRMKHKNGNWVWILDRGKLVNRTPDGGPGIMFGTQTDITALKNAELQLSAVADNIPGAIFRYQRFPDGSDKLMNMSQGSRKLWGMSPEEAMNHNDKIWGMYHPEDLPQVQASINESMLHLSRWEAEWRMMHPDGSIRWERGIGQPSRLPDGSTVWDSIILDITSEKEISLQLEINEKRFKSLVENSNDVVVILNETGSATYVSPSIQHVLGYTVTEALQLNLFEILHPEDAPFVTERFGVCLQQPGVPIAGYTSRVKHKDGRWRWLEATITNRLDDPLFRGIIDNFRDVTEQHEAALALQQAEARRKKAQNIAKLGYWQYEVDSNRWYWGEEINQLLGIEVGKSVDYDGYKKLIHPDDLSKINDARENAIASKSALNCEYRLLLNKHQVRWVHEIGELEINVQGQRILNGTIQDITAKKEEEAQLRLFETIITSTYDAVFISDASEMTEPGPYIRFANEAFCKLSGYSQSELIGQSARLILGANSQAEEVEKLKLAVETKSAGEAELLVYRKNKQPFWAHIRMKPVVDEKGWLSHWITLIQDISERKQTALQQQLFTDIANYFNANESMQSTMQRVLARLVSFGDFMLAESWLLSSDGKSMQMSAHFTDSQAGREFYEKTSHIRQFQRREGLIGKCWKSKKLIFKEVNDKASDFQRLEAAQKAGLVFLIAVPLVHLNQVLGVVVIGVNRKIYALDTLKKLLENLGREFGIEVKRKLLELELSQMFNASPDIICIANILGEFTRVNPTTLELFGYTEAEIIGRSILDFVHPDDRELVANNLAGWHALQPKHYFENRFLTKKGKVLWLAWTASPSPDDGLIYAVAKDISEKKRLEDLLNKATDMSLIGGWEADLIQMKMQWSPMTRQIHEVAPDFNPPLEDSERFIKLEEDKQKIIAYSLEAMQNGSSWDIELPIITAKGNEKWVRVIGQAELVNGICTRLYGSFQDIDERKRTELSLAQKSKFLSSNSAIVALFLAFENWQEALQPALQLMGEAVGVDRAYYFENFIHPENGRLYTRQLREYAHPAVSAQIDNPDYQFIPLDEHPEFLTKAKAGKPFSYITSELAEGPTKKLLEEQDIQSILQIPVIKNGEFVGYIGFDQCTHARQWTAEEISFLEGLSNSLSVAIHRKEQLDEITNAYAERNNILESISEGFIMLNRSWEIIYWNHAAEIILQAPKKDRLGYNIWEIYEDAVATEFFNQYKQVMEMGKSTHFEAFYAGLSIWVEVSAYPFNNGISIFFRDVTNRRHQENALRIANERFELVSQATDEAIWDWDLSNNHLYRGDGFARLFGEKLDQRTVDISEWEQKIHPEDLQRITQKLELAIEQPDKTRWEDEYRYQRSDGSFAYVIDRAAIMRDEKGKATRLIGAVQDISERKQQEEKLKKLNRELEKKLKELAISNAELEQFAYVASHDLQEPLRMVTSFLTQLEKKYSDKLDDKAHQYIHFATDGAFRMRQIILDLLEYSRVGRSEDKVEPIEISSLLEEITLLFRKKIDESKASIHWDEMPVIKAQKTPIRQLFQNLLSNALKYVDVDKKPIIQLKVEDLGNEWQFAIEDNGIGIAPEFHSKIFIIFQRLHNRDAYSGTGMGLAICKKIIDNLGGKIWVKSEEGKGSTFYFTLPKS